MFVGGIGVEYVIIGLVAILATTLIVYKLANCILGINLRLRPLILCAGFSMILSLILPHMVVGFAGLTGTLALLAVFALFFAYFVAYYDGNLVEQHEKTNLQNHSDDLRIHIPLSDLGELSAAVTDRDFEIKDEKHISAQVKIRTITDGSIYAVAVNEITSDQSNKAKEVAVTCGENKNNTSGVSREGNFSQAEGEDNPNIVENEQPATIADGPLNDTKPASDSLDDLLDYAFWHKERRYFDSALSAFQKALKLYPGSEAAPFLVVEVGDLFKHRGAYDEAISIFIEGRNLPQLKNDVLLEQEFISTIAYLRIIKNVLVQHCLGSIPYSLIPESIRYEIDEEFREWRKLT
ncbi:MAG TPA: hypothetical protein PKA28_01365 [Methylomusa anaerophila]|uniref:Uncharacterized protein n=1 Tax=Methylomusa anaerophila TaxID=1930071 RepID=A0A348APT9_9FIRM|nr:hypothetical protein [Methylomusa anaerophila]BBB93087.1 hypothetical protein MAMMFC1_03796 [Methylomusa anaerophila]HML87080.1 hypothetical protein [Methylomusa anaerophila]